MFDVFAVLKCWCLMTTVLVTELITGGCVDDFCCWVGADVSSCVLITVREYVLVKHMFLAALFGHKCSLKITKHAPPFIMDMSWYVCCNVSCVKVHDLCRKTFEKFQQVAPEVKSIIRDKMNERLNQLQALQIRAPVPTGRLVTRSCSLDSETSSGAESASVFEREMLVCWWSTWAFAIQ